MSELKINRQNTYSSFQVEESLSKCKEQLSEMYNLSPELFPKLKPEPPKTVTSMYGKVYNLKTK